MERPGLLNRMISLAALVALLTLLFPAAAEAKFPAEGSEAPAGITVRGLGFAKGGTDAARRAVGDARGRAEEIAAVLGLQIGQVEEVDLPELTQFGGDTRRCGGNGNRPGRCGPTAAAAVVTYAIVGGAAEGAPRVVGASGTASAAVEPRNRSRNRSIRRAILATRSAVTPEAAAAALRNARTAAVAAGLQLGPIVSVAETAPSYYYGPSFYDFALGSFGPGRFCGIVRRPVIRRDSDTGATRVVRRVPHRRCYVPIRYDVHLEIRYELR